MGKNILISENQLGDLVMDLINLALTGSTDDSKKTSTSTTSPSNFDEQINKVIDKFEGGYYNPTTMKTAAMGNSGETMMGIDRKHGGDLNKSSAGQEFWKLIDDANAKDNWKYNYKGGSLEPKLRSLVSQIMKPSYEQLSNTYLSSEAKKIVQNDPNLSFNFVYATFNGPLYFKNFAKKINSAVDRGVTEPKDLMKVAIEARKESGNSLIVKSGNKMAELTGTV